MTADFCWVEYTSPTQSAEPNHLNLGSTNAVNMTAYDWPITTGTYSYSKYVAGYWYGTFSYIQNLKFWVSNSCGGYVTGEDLKWSGTTTSYAGTDASSVVTPTNSADALANQDMVWSEPATNNLGFAGNNASNSCLDASGKSDWLVLQASITLSATEAVTNTKTFTLQYEEV